MGLAWIIGSFIADNGLWIGLGLVGLSVVVIICALKCCSGRDRYWS